jgi:hypothetical protein
MSSIEDDSAGEKPARKPRARRAKATGDEEVSAAAE